MLRCSAVRANMPSFATPDAWHLGRHVRDTNKLRTTDASANAASNYCRETGNILSNQVSTE